MTASQNFLTLKKIVRFYFFSWALSKNWLNQSLMSGPKTDAGCPKSDPGEKTVGEVSKKFLEKSMAPILNIKIWEPT